MARLIRTEKEVEGRREEIWLVVDEDAQDQWPAGPRDVVGRHRTRHRLAETTVGRDEIGHRAAEGTANRAPSQTPMSSPG